MSLLHFSEHLALPFMFADAWKSYLITLNIDVDCLLIAFEIFFFFKTFNIRWGTESESR